MKRAIALCLAAASLFAGALSVGAAARGDGSKVDVSNMDLDLLRENLLKVWILEYQSSNYNQSRIAEKSFEGLNRVRRQQRVNAILKSRFDSGELHALSMRTLTPEEWKANG